MESIHFGPRDECFAIEKRLRPLPGMGLNDISGGKGGFSIATLKGKSLRFEHLHEQPVVERWQAKDPAGTIYSIDDLGKFCDDNDLRASILWKYMGRKVPKFRQFREHQPAADFRRQRDKTTGWTLIPSPKEDIPL